jgi:hypothetical protein
MHSFIPARNSYLELQVCYSGFPNPKKERTGQKFTEFHSTLGKIFADRRDLLKKYEIKIQG